MKRSFPLRRTERDGERGYAMLAILLALMLLLLVMTVSAPVIAHQIKRDREEEMIHRGRQYVRGLQRYYRKFGRYPAKLEDLESSNNLRFLRRRYKDPMTESGDWRIIHLGEARPKAGQPFGGTSGQPAIPGAQPAGGMSGQSGAGAGRTGQLAGDSLTGRRFGGGPIVGVASKSEEQSIRELEGKSHYNEWEFVYDVSQDLGARLPGQTGQPGQAGQPGRPGQPGFTGTPMQGPQPQKPPDR